MSWCLLSIWLLPCLKAASCSGWLAVPLCPMFFREFGAPWREPRPWKLCLLEPINFLVLWSAHGEGGPAFMRHSPPLGTFLLLPITPYTTQAGGLKSQVLPYTLWLEPYRNHALCPTDCSHPPSTLRSPSIFSPSASGHHCISSFNPSPSSTKSFHISNLFCLKV